MIRTINLGVTFLLELAVLLAVGYWGFSLTHGAAVRLLTALGGPLLMAILWGVFAAPKASAPLNGVAGVAFRIMWFGIGALAFWFAGTPLAALVLAALYAANALMLRRC